MVEAPASLHASDRIQRAPSRGEDRQDEQRIGVDDREAGDQQRKAEAQKNQKNSTEEGSPARVEKAR